MELRVCVCTVVGESSDYFHVAVHMNMCTKLRPCRSVGKRFFSLYVWLQCLCLICGIPVATNPDPSGNYTHSLQTHFQGNEELPCGSWRTQLCKISGNIEHGISNFLIWQVDSNRTKEDCVRQRCKLEIRNITNSNGTKKDCVRQRCKLEIRNITNRSNRTKQDCVRQRCKLEIRNITNHTQD